MFCPPKRAEENQYRLSEEDFTELEKASKLARAIRSVEPVMAVWKVVAEKFAVDIDSIRPVDLKDEHDFYAIPKQEVTTNADC